MAPRARKSRTLVQIVAFRSWSSHEGRMVSAVFPSAHMKALNKFIEDRSVFLAGIGERDGDERFTVELRDDHGIAIVAF